MTSKPKKKKAKEQLEDRRSLLDPKMKEQMLAIIIRNPVAFESVKDLLTNEAVSNMGAGLALVWQVVKDFYAQYAELPSAEQLNVELHNWVSADPELLGDEEKEEVDDFVDYAFDRSVHKANLSKSKKHASQAIETCRLLLEEFEVQRLRQLILNNNTVPADLMAALTEQCNRIALSTSLTTPGIEEVFPSEWEKESDLPMIPTGVGPIDMFLGGGPVPGEVIAFMGPQGSCKTTTCVQVACNMAEYGANLYLSGLAQGGKRPVSILASTELELKELRIRALAYLAQIPSKRLRAQLAEKSLSGFSNDNKPGQSKETKYERKMFKDAYESNDGFMNERARIASAISLMQEHFVFINATPSNKLNPNLGKGGVPELATTLASYLRKHPDVRPVSFVLDHASAMASRMNAGKDPDNLRHVLKDIPLQVKDMLCSPYGIWAFIAHQMSGESTKKGPTADFHHSDAAECKMFAEYCAWAITTGPITEDKLQLARFRCTKHRREPPKSHAVVQLLGNFNKIIDRSKDFVVDTQSRRFVSKEELKAHGASSTKFKSKKNDGDDDDGIKAVM
jgi:hypothetical protein